MGESIRNDLSYLLIVSISVAIALFCAGSAVAKTPGERLVEASREGERDVVERLLAEGASVDANHRKLGSTPLIAAAYEGRLNVVKLLLEHGADVNARDERFGATPLIAASYKGHVEIVKMLLDHGADMFAKDRRYGADAMRSARFARNAAVVELLKAYEDRAASVSERGKGETDRKPAPVDARELTAKDRALHAAAAIGDHEAAARLVREGARVNARDQEGLTPLIKASIGGHFSTVKALIGNGADVNATAFYYCWAPLDKALDTCLTKVSGALLNEEAKTPSANPALKGGITPLDAAKRNGHHSVKWLLERYGAKENVGAKE